MLTGRSLIPVFLAVFFTAYTANAGIFDDVKKFGDDLAKGLGDVQKSIEDAVKPDKKPKPQPAPGKPGGTGANEPRFDPVWVSEIQQRLNDLGFPAGAVDGAFGNGTRKALKKFEKSRGLPINGLPTPSAMTALRAESETQTTGTTTTTSDGGQSPSPSTAAASPSSPLMAGDGLSEDLLPADPVMQNGRLLTGLPLYFGAYKGEPVPFHGGKQPYAHVELARFIDLLIVQSDATILDDPNVAREYAYRFLAEDVQPDFLAACPLGRCTAASTVPFQGWVGENEFEREAAYRLFVDTYAAAIRAMAAPAPVQMLHILEVKLQPYDKSVKGFPITVFRNTNLMGRVGQSHRLFAIDQKYTLPTTVPVARENAPAFLTPLGDRKAYLALGLSLNQPMPEALGSMTRLISAVSLDSAALYADADLSQQVHEFALHKAGGGLVGAAGTKGPKTAGAAAKIVRGPGGEELIEFAMPAGMRTIRFIGLGGEPVAGYPVSRGALNPSDWKKRHGYVPDIDINFARLLSALHLQSNQRLLQGVTFSERFAQEHLDKDSRRRFFGKAGSAFTSGTFGANEIERKQRFQQFLQEYDGPLKQMLPAVPINFVLVDQLHLQRYDEARQLFTLRNLSGGGQGLFSQARRLVPQEFKMAPGPAEALLNRAPNRTIFIALAMTISAVVQESNGRQTFDLLPRAITLYEDEALKKQIHQFPLPKVVKKIAAAKVAGDPLTRDLGRMYIMRDVDGAISKKGLLAATERLIGHEQSRWKRFDAVQAQGHNSFCPDKKSVLEWASIRAKRPAFAEGALLAPFYQPYADWSFLEKETPHGLSADHCVDLFLFSRADVENKQPDFAARKLYPVYQQSLELALKSLPDQVFLTIGLPALDYDFDSGELFFVPKQSGSYKSKNKPAHMLTRAQSLQFVTGGQIPKNASSSSLLAPKHRQGLAFYAIGNLSDPKTPPPGAPMQPRSITRAKNGEAWRQVLGDRAWGKNYLYGIALDRFLPFPRLKMPEERAAKILAAVRQGGNRGLRAVIELTVEAAHTVALDRPATLYASLSRVRILTAKGRLIASIAAADFPDAVAAQRQKQIANLKQAETAAQQQQAQKKEAEEKRQAEARIESENLSRSATCDGAASAQAQLACYRETCAWLAGEPHAKAQQKRRCQGQLATAEGNVQAQSQRLASQCQQKLSARSFQTWSPPRESKEYRQAVAECTAVAERQPYGRDMVGLRLGMHVSDASNIVRSRLESRQGAGLKVPRPFEAAALSWSDDASRGIALFTIYNHGRRRLGGISRRLYFDTEGPDVSAITESMREKYGPEFWSDGNGKLLWAFGADQAAKSSAQCGKLVDSVSPRDGWSRSWRRRLSAADRRQQSQMKSDQILAQAQRQTACIAAAQAKAGTNVGHGDDEASNKAMAAVNTEMAECQQKFGSPSSTGVAKTAEAAPRLPLMIPAAGSPQSYGDYAACGPVLIAVLDADQDGQVKDAAFVMFDPRWLADQPGFAFKSGGTGSAKQTKKKKIEF